MNATSGVPLTAHLDRVAIRRWASQTVFALPVGIALLLLTIASAFLLGLGPLAEVESRRLESSTNVVLHVINNLLIAPFLETAVMGWLIILLLNLRLNRYLVTAVSAVLWAALHQIQSPVGWVVGIPFFFLSYIYIKRRERPESDAFIVVAMAHFYYNATSAIMAFTSGVLTWHT